MIIKLTLCGLIIVLIAVLAISYYMNEEGFDDITFKASGTMNVGKDADTGAPHQKASAKKGPPAGMPQVGVASDPVVTGSIPSNNTVAPQITVGDDSHAAMLLQQKSELLQDLQKIVRNEMLAQRSTNPVGPSGASSSDTHSTAQGKEYSRKNHKRDDSTDDSDCDHPNGYKPNKSDDSSCDHPNGYKPNKSDDSSCDHPNGYKPNKSDDSSCDHPNGYKPDMRQYIKKDSIPCMNCNLDY